MPSAAFSAGGDLQQAQLDRHVRAEQLAGGDAEEQGVADLAGRAGDGDVHGSAGHGVLRMTAGGGASPAPCVRRISRGDSGVPPWRALAARSTAQAIRLAVRAPHTLRRLPEGSGRTGVRHRQGDRRSAPDGACIAAGRQPRSAGPGHRTEKRTTSSRNGISSNGFGCAISASSTISDTQQTVGDHVGEPAAHGQHADRGQQPAQQRAQEQRRAEHHQAGARDVRRPPAPGPAATMPQTTRIGH